jgi:hypothetical protein
VVNLEEVFHGEEPAAVDAAQKGRFYMEGQMKMDMPLDKWMKLYKEKEKHLQTFCEEVTPEEFYRELWPAGSFERVGHPEDGKPNAIALTIKSKGKAYHTLITDGLEQLPELLKEDFVIAAPIGYWGRRRTGENARYAYGIAFDLDGVGMPQLRDTLHQMEVGIIPKATYVVNSGRGLHLYYFFDVPKIMLPTVQKALKELKYDLTRYVIWNRFTSTRQEPEVQGILQGFRMVGSPSKLGEEYPVKAYRVGDRVTVDYLAGFLPRSTGSYEKVVDLLSALDKVHLKEAETKWPEWYQRRVVEKKPRGRWPVKRDLYDWWKERVKLEITVGHRYFGIMTLAIYAKKCSEYNEKWNPNPVTEEELRRDAYSLLAAYDAMSVEDVNRFTEDDIEAALNIFQESYVTFPRDDIAKLTGIELKKNKRNGRKQKQHMKVMSAVRDVLYEDGAWRNKEGRPTKEQQVRELRAEHPEASISELSRLSGISRPTLYKYLENS